MEFLEFLGVFEFPRFLGFPWSFWDFFGIFRISWISVFLGVFVGFSWDFWDFLDFIRIFGIFGIIWDFLDFLEIFGILMGFSGFFNISRISLF